MWLITFVLSIFLMIGSAGAENAFTIGVLSDTQNYVDVTKSQPESTEVFNAQTQYLADNKNTLNLVFVTHVGDVVQNGDGTNGTEGDESYGGSLEWDRAYSAMAVLADAGVPFGMSPGNHDYDNYKYETGSRPLVSDVMWKRYFGSDSAFFSLKTWYGGASDSLTYSPGISSYQTFVAGGKKFLHISLEMEAGDDALAWAQGVIDAHNGFATIITTHENLNPPANTDDSAPLVVPAPRTGDSYLNGSPAGWNDAQNLWDKFLSKNDQIFMLICGHASGSAVDGVSKAENIRIDNNEAGHPVYQILTDYQNNTSGGSSGGDGWLRLMTFDMEANTIHFSTYSPTLDKWAGQNGEWTFNQHPEFSDFTIDMPVQVINAVDGNEALGKWVAGDFHNHTWITDGSVNFDEVYAHGFTYGLDWLANSEHGGTSDENNIGENWSDILDSSKFMGNPDPYPNLWRWQTLADDDKVPAYLNALRTAYPNKLLVNGLEMNMPGAEHCSTAIIDATGYAIAQFEYLWDRGDSDTSGGYGFELAENNGVSKNTTNDLTKAAQAAAWMQTHYRGLGWMVPTHPERAADLDWSDGNPSNYGPNFFRTLNDAGPDICFGFESAPGHQKSSGRGGYSSNAYGGGTYGGVGYFAATVGGLWDALLGEGRNWWLFASSDFHSTSGDFWPGEYQKTYSYLTDANNNSEYDGADIVSSLRSGNSFIVFGDLIDELDFTVKDRIRGTAATMGETLNIRRNGLIEVSIRFKSPAVNSNGDVPTVAHVQLIAGEVTGKLTPNNPDYATSGVNPTTQVVATYDPSSWTETEDGYTECKFQMRRVNKNMYFRVRGNNLPPGTAYETDDMGNPLLDNLVHDGLGIDGAEEAWADLWFYSNPIFVSIN